MSKKRTAPETQAAKAALTGVQVGQPVVVGETALAPVQSAENPWLAARNILAVRLDNIGDVLMTGPALRAVKETSPQARITLLCSPGGATAAPLLPWVDDVRVWRPIWQDVGNRMAFDPAREMALITDLAARHFDAAIIFTSFSQDPHAPGYVCYLAGIPLRAGEAKEFGGSVLSTELKGAPDNLHQVERNLRLVEQLGFVARNRQLVAAISAAARANAASLLTACGIDPDQPYIVLHPGASAQARRYPTERFGQVAHQLTQRGWSVLVTAVEREEHLIATMREYAPDAAYLLGRTTLPEYAALLERAALVICNDTLPMHLADAVGTPEVVTFAGTDLEAQWEPRQVTARLLRRPTPCRPCYLFACPIGLACLDIPPEEVVRHALAVLAEAGVGVGKENMTERGTHDPVGAMAPSSPLDKPQQSPVALPLAILERGLGGEASVPVHTEPIKKASGDVR